MEDWKFLINRLFAFIVMIGSFIGATLGYYDKIVEAVGKNIFKFFLFTEAVGIVVVFLLILKVMFDYVKDIKEKKWYLIL